MQQKTNILLLLILNSLNLIAQNENEIARDLRAKNKIKEKFTYIHNLQTGDSLLKNHEKFDKKGNLIEDMRFDEKGNLKFMYLLEFKNNLMTRQTGYDKNKSVSTILTYKYDKDGNRIEYKQLSPDGKTLNFQKRSYNDLNQNTELYNWNKNDDTFVLSQKYYYTEANKYSKIESYIGDYIATQSEYEYDVKGNLVAIYKVENDEKTLLNFYIYNDKNLLTESTYKIKSHQLINGKAQLTDISKKTNCEYDNENNVVREFVFENDKLVEKKTFLIRKFN